MTKAFVVHQKDDTEETHSNMSLIHHAVTELKGSDNVENMESDPVMEGPSEKEETCLKSDRKNITTDKNQTSPSNQDQEGRMILRRYPASVVVKGTPWD
ncbi:hypothetical protein Hamer_G028235 [Homarus americanus]|uniref:Uncharacterized protein n=1 Tax=Homarus americanus TaxID=6706 RepID=A0A8J5K8K7_HOMAM|nr:hypothetical protein Hamer_G028235 [Homarus americanus]